jgi:hypothetical protein
VDDSTRKVGGTDAETYSSNGAGPARISKSNVPRASVVVEAICGRNHFQSLTDANRAGA